MNEQPVMTERPRCNASIDGPIGRWTGSGRSRPLWRRLCRNFVKHAGDRCHLHKEKP